MCVFPTFSVGQILNVCDVASDVRFGVRLFAQASVYLHQDATHQLLGLGTVQDQLLAFFPDLQSVRTVTSQVCSK